eukprot:COSAG02_NODE_80_length_40128_cov_591.169002_34_plen_94_part_00
MRILNSIYHTVHMYQYTMEYLSNLPVTFSRFRIQSIERQIWCVPILFPLHSLPQAHSREGRGAWGGHVGGPRGECNQYTESASWRWVGIPCSW